MKSEKLRTRRLSGLSIALTLSLAASGASLPSAAQTVSTEEIIRRLTPHQETRSPRGVSVEPGALAEKPSIDLYINFEFDSAKLDTDGLLVLRRLGVALRDPKLADYRFEIAGHTDATGTTEYNQSLSERRAATVRDHLVFYYEVDPKRLQAKGYGKSRLLAPDKPIDSVNRRVQITNIGL